MCVYLAYASHIQCIRQIVATDARSVWVEVEYGLTARRGHKVQRGQNLSDHAQLLTTLSFMHMQRIYKPKIFILIEFRVFNK